MNRTRPYLNRFVKRKEQQIEDIYHLANLKQIKPMTTKLMQHAETIVINHRKAEIIKEIKQIQIERENKLLLSKIARVMQTKGAYSVVKTKSYTTKTNKSLNDGYRKKQMDTIVSQNKRFLIRLQKKRATLDLDQLSKDWVDNKNVIKRMANCDFNLTNIQSRVRTNSTIERSHKNKFDNIKMCKIKIFKNTKMLIKVEMEDNMLKITGDSQSHKNLKVIQIPKDEAIDLIQKQCNGKVSILIDKIRYDAQSESIYLIQQNMEQKDTNIAEYNPQISHPQKSKHIYQNKNIKMESAGKKHSSFSHKQSRSLKQQDHQMNSHVPILPSLEFKTAKIAVNSFQHGRIQNFSSDLDSLPPNNFLKIAENQIERKSQQVINHEQKIFEHQQEKISNQNKSKKLQEKQDQYPFDAQQAIEQKKSQKEIIIEPQQNEDYGQEFADEFRQQLILQA